MLGIGGEFNKAAMTLAFTASQLHIFGEETGIVSSGATPIFLPLVYKGPGIVVPEIFSLQAYLTTNAAPQVNVSTISYIVKTLYTDRLLFRSDQAPLSNNNFTLGYSNMEDGIKVENGDGFMVEILYTAGGTRYFSAQIQGVEYI